MKTVDHLAGADFESRVLKADGPVLVDFYAPWCGPCRALGPVLEQLAPQYDGKVQFYKVNVDEEPGLAGALEISGVPTVLMFRNGNVVDGFVGFNSAQSIRERLDNVIAAPTEQKA